MLSELLATPAAGTIVPPPVVVVVIAWKYATICTRMQGNRCGCAVITTGLSPPPRLPPEGRKESSSSSAAAVMVFVVSQSFRTLVSAVIKVAATGAAVVGVSVPDGEGSGDVHGVHGGPVIVHGGVVVAPAGAVAAAAVVVDHVAVRRLLVDDVVVGKHHGRDSGAVIRR